MRPYAIERYGRGWIVADYSGNRGSASYCGQSGSWTRQPHVDDPFPSEESATKFAEENVKEKKS